MIICHQHRSFCSNTKPGQVCRSRCYWVTWVDYRSQSNTSIYESEVDHVEAAVIFRFSCIISLLARALPSILQLSVNVWIWSMLIISITHLKNKFAGNNLANEWQIFPILIANDWSPMKTRLYSYAKLYHWPSIPSHTKTSIWYLLLITSWNS